MGNLICNLIDFNDYNSLLRLKKVIQTLITTCTFKFQLQYKKEYYFEIRGHKEILRERGWYIIFHNRHPIYVGETTNFNNRLNTTGGTTDNFGSKKRSRDNRRNFIKKFNELGFLPKLEVWIIREKDLIKELNLNTDELTKLDRINVEKFIDIFRNSFDFQDGENETKPSR